MNYVVSFADILLVSDAIGVSSAKGVSPYSYNQLVQLVRLKSLIKLDMMNKRVIETYSGEEVTEKWLSNLFITNNYTKPTNYLIVSKEYVDRAWDIIKPCLDYVLTLADYVELDRPVARLMDYMRRVKYSSHSDAMRNTNLSAKNMEIAVLTLTQRKDIKIVRKEVQTHGRGVRKAAFYKWIGS